MKIRKLPEQEKRVESGPVCFGDDWPGLFLRGDSCIWAVTALKTILAETKFASFIEEKNLQDLIKYFESPLRKLPERKVDEQG